MMMKTTELRDFCERIARLETERKSLSADIAEIRQEAKSLGYDVALIGKTVRIILMEERKKVAALRQLDLFETYLSAAGVTPPLDLAVTVHDPVTGEVLAS